MAESRRVELTTLPCNVPICTLVEKPTLAPTSTQCASTSAALLQGKGNDSEEPNQTEPTVRCVLALFESDERTFPEFSYTELFNNQRNMIVTGGDLQRTFRQEEIEDKDEVAAIARRFEKKYGRRNERKRDRIQDLVDIGYGYDDEDSFIDNTEAYDEFVPASLTTKHGGFYINSGVLQFRQVSDTESEDSTAQRKALRPPKKRRLNEGGQNKPKKKCKEAGQMKSAVVSKRGTLSEIGPEARVKKKKLPGPLSVTNMLKKFQREKERERQKSEKDKWAAPPVAGTPAIPLFPADAAGGGGAGLADPLLSLIGSTNDHALIQAASTVDFDIDLDSLLEATEENSQPKSQLQPAVETQFSLLSTPKTAVQSQSTVLSQGQSQPESKIKGSAQSRPQPELPQPQLLSEAQTTPLHQLVPLPEGLPPVLARRIGELNVAAKSSERESKLKFFTPEINVILLDIELQCRELGGQVRSKVYTHLSSFLPCSRETLLKRVKKLRQAHADPMQKLKEAIGRAMPEQLARFHDNYQAHAQVKSTKVTEEGREREQRGTVGSEDERSAKRAPQKKFKWNEEIRECLCDVVRVKLDRYGNERSDGQEMDEYLKSFLDNEVRPLWPKGWMQPRVLLKESRKGVGPPTSLPVKKAKSEKKQSFTSDAPKHPSGSSDSADPHAPQGAPPLQGGLSMDAGDALNEDLVPNPLPLASVGGALDALTMVENKGKEGVEVDFGFPTLVETDERPLCDAASAPPAAAHSLLDLLAEQALARGQLVKDSMSQELLAAAVASARWKPSDPYWSLGVDLKSPPFPPPPPQSSPVMSPGNEESHLFGHPLLQVAKFPEHRIATKTPGMSDDPDVTTPGTLRHGYVHNGCNALGEGQDAGRNLQE